MLIRVGQQFALQCCQNWFSNDLAETEITRKKRKTEFQARAVLAAMKPEETKEKINCKSNFTAEKRGNSYQIIQVLSNIHPVKSVYNVLCQQRTFWKRI